MPEVTAAVRVTLAADGQIGLEAKGDKVTVLGLLEMAKNLLLNQPQQQGPPPILLARGNLPNGS